MGNQKGQIVLILVLVMTVALAIGIAVVQRSLSDISTATKVEQSSRAFSAAEAGIEKAIQANSPIPIPYDLGNSSKIQNVDKIDLGGSSQAIEYPLLAKEELAHIWLADPNALPTAQFYNRPEIDIYWGKPNITSDKPAIEITVVYKDASNAYQPNKFFLDSDSPRTSSNKFTDVSRDCTSNPATTDTNLGTGRTFFCKTRLDLTRLATLMLVRARFLYSSADQPFAVQPVGGNLPLQGSQFAATGTSGQTQRRIRVFRIDKVVPPYFDYAIFSAGDINK